MKSKEPRDKKPGYSDMLTTPGGRRRPVLVFGVLLVLGAVLLANGATDVTRELRARPQRRLQVEAELDNWCRIVAADTAASEQWQQQADHDRTRFLSVWTIPDLSERDSVPKLGSRRAVSGSVTHPARSGVFHQ